MKKGIIIFITFITVIFLFTSCSNRNDIPNIPFEDDTTNSVQEPESNSKSGIPLSSCSEGLYIKKGDLFYPVNSQVYYTAENGAKRYSNIMGIGMLKTNEIPNISWTDDELVIFSDAEEIQYFAIPVAEYGYCFQGIIDQTGHNFDESYQFFYKLKNNPKGFDSLNGVDISSITDLAKYAEETDMILHQEPTATKQYSFLFSKEKRDLDAVYFEGTNAVEYSLNIDTPAVLVNSDEKLFLKEIKTTDGYFSIDLTPLNADKYVIVLRYGAVPFDHCYLIDIK